MIRTTKECSHERLRLVRRLVELRLKLVMVTEMKAMENRDLINSSKVVFGHHLSIVWKPNFLENQFCDVCTKTVWKYMHQLYECAGKTSLILVFVKIKWMKNLIKELLI